ncbi:MAG: hypothetical protein KC419_18335 [Anaerolineales bacterium]|nr:hypothetical protein [Anaerolineales bacterium]
MSAAQPQNAFTDAPWLQENLILGSIRLLFWLFFHPSAWRSHLNHVDASLPANFCLAELRQWQWRNPALLRLLIAMFLVWPFLLAGLIAVILRLFSLPLSSILLGVILGVAFGIVSGLLVSVAGSVSVGAPVGLGVGLVAGSLGSQFITSFDSITLGAFVLSGEIVLPVVIGLAGGLAGGLGYGVAAGVMGALHTPETTSSLTRQVSGVFVGVLIGVGGGLITGVVQNGMATAVMVGVPFGLAVGWRTQRRQSGLIAAVIAGLAGGLLDAAGGSVEILQLTGIIALAALMMSLFAVPYVLAERIAGSEAGTIAGALGGAGGLFLFFTDGAEVVPFLWFSLAGILLGFTLAWWRPVLFYPLVFVWNAVLLRLDERRLVQTKRPSLLRRHSAFWDELQRLPLVNLDVHLLLVLTHRPKEGQAALAYLNQSRQRWAAQAAQIEMDARQLEGVETITAVSRAHQHLSAGELAGPASALLRSFSRLSQDVEAAQNQESAYNQRLALNAVADRLNNLLRELTRSAEPYAGRFHPIAESWRQIVSAQSQVLADEAELRQEIDSPYIIGVPLTEAQEIFIGRTDVSARIEQLLLDRRRPPLLLYGQRRVGKTSLLHNLGRLLPSTIVPLFVDLQGPASRAGDEAGFLVNIARGMMRSARRQRQMVLPSLTRDALLDDPFTRFEEWLDDVERVLGPNMALLMLDEFEALEQMLAKGRFDEAVILGMLRHLIQHRPRFKVLLSGSHTLEEFQRWSSYLINVQVIHIGYLQPAETRQLVEAPVPEFALRYQADASRRVLDLTQGHPFLVQLICAEIVALKNEQPSVQRRLALREDVETAVLPALEHGSFFFADIEKNQVDGVAAEVLRLIAQHGEGTAVPRQVLVDYVPSLMALEQALVDLQHRELIEQVEGGYRFQVELIRRWFAKRP